MKTLPPGKEKAALQVAMSGGMITRFRTFQKHGPPKTDCPYGCDAPDSDVHRFWECARWADKRGDLATLVKDLPTITRCTGWFLRDHDVPYSVVSRVQRFMLNVVLALTRDFHGSDSGRYDPDCSVPESPSEPSASDAVCEHMRSAPADALAGWPDSSRIDAQQDPESGQWDYSQNQGREVGWNAAMPPRLREREEAPQLAASPPIYARALAPSMDWKATQEAYSCAQTAAE